MVITMRQPEGRYRKDLVLIFLRILVPQINLSILGIFQLHFCFKSLFRSNSTFATKRFLVYFPSPIDEYRPRDQPKIVSRNFKSHRIPQKVYDPPPEPAIIYHSTHDTYGLQNFLEGNLKDTVYSYLETLRVLQEVVTTRQPEG